MLRNHAFGIHGHVSRGFEAVHEVFTENFVRRGELGGACCAFVRGEKVVDLWGGIRTKQTGEPWEEDTMVVVHSATKGLAAMTLAIAHSQGWLDYEQPVCAYWPEFAQNGKERITVRQLLPVRQACSRSMNPWIVASWQILIACHARSSETSVGAGHAPSVPRAHARLLRRRAAAPRGSAASQPGAVLPR